MTDKDQYPWQLNVTPKNDWQHVPYFAGSSVTLFGVP